jgi:predicted nucleotidyltransferase
MIASGRTEIDQIKQQLLPFFKNSSTQKVYLFGSFAKGTQTRKSDLDLMIIADTKKRFFKRYEDYERIIKILDGYSVDMLIYTPAELSNIDHRPFIKKILAEGQVIYEC